MARYLLSIRHVANCFPDYLQDHCNGESELLCGVPLAPSTRWRDVVEELEREALQCEKFPDDMTNETITRAIRDYVKASGIDKRKAFEARPDSIRENEDSPYAWFRFSWEEDKSPEISSNGHWRDLISWHDLPESARDNFDYLEEEERHSARLVKYGGRYIDTGDTMALDADSEFNRGAKKWHAYSPDTYFSGLLFKFSRDGESVMVARYFV